MECAVCGATNEAGAAFCDRCGSALRPVAPATGQTIDLSRAQVPPGVAPLPPAAAATPRPPAPAAAPELRDLPFPPPPAPMVPRVYEVPTSNRAPYIVASAPPTVRTSNLAIFSLVLGIMSWTLLPGLAAIAAVITGHMGRREVEASGGGLGGGGLATAGLIMGYLNLAALLIGLVILCLLVGVFANMR